PGPSSRTADQEACTAPSDSSHSKWPTCCTVKPCSPVSGPNGPKPEGVTHTPTIRTFSVGLRGDLVSTRPGGDLVMLAVGLRGLQFRRRDRLHTVLVAELGELLQPALLLVTGARHTVGVLGRLDFERLRTLRADQNPTLVLVQRLVHLDELPGGEPHDASGLVAMQRQLTVLALQPDTDPLGHHERDHRQHEEQ